MAAFDDPAVFGDEKLTKDALKSAFAKVKAGGETKFIYYEKLTVGTKEVAALAFVDFAPDFESKLKKATTKAPLARGYCHLTPDNEIAFVADTGTPKLEVLKKYLATVSGVKPVNTASQEAPAALGAKAAKPDSALLKRLAELNAQVKKLPGDAGDSFIPQIKKLAALIQSGEAKDAQAAAKLLDTLEPMLNKQQSRQAPQVDDAVLKQVSEAVAKAYAALPKQPASLRADIEATAEAKDFAKLARDPAQARQAAVAAKPLLKKIEEIRALAQAWPATAKQALEQFADAVKQERGKIAKGGEARVDSHEDHPSALRVKALCADPAAYAKGAELKQAMLQQAQALKELVEKIGLWDEAQKQASAKLNADLKGLDEAYAKKIQDALPKEPVYLEWKDLVERGKKKVLDAKEIDVALRKMRERMAAMADEEKRRVQAAEVKLKLQAHRPTVDKAVTDCEAQRARAAAALPAVEASWRTVAVQTELTADADEVGRMRTAAAKLRDEIDADIAAMAAATPPAASAIKDAEKRLGTALPNLAEISKRITRNLKTTTPEGILTQLEVMLQAAATGQHLSNMRIGNLRAALKRAPKNRTQAQADIDDAVFAQNHPKPGDWFKVLQLPNVRASGDLRVAKVGDVTLDGKRVDVHMTLYLANVDVHNSPHLGMTAGAIIDAMLPDVVGSVGTHVTAEVLGEKSLGNPHCFKGAASGVPNTLDGHAKWGEIETAMFDLLAKEIARLTALVQQHIDRHGVWPGE
jgi:hypothetical protein